MAHLWPWRNGNERQLKAVEGECAGHGHRPGSGARRQYRRAELCVQTSVGSRGQRRIEEQHLCRHQQSNARFSRHYYTGESVLLRFEMLPGETTTKVTLSFGASALPLRRGEPRQSWNWDWDWIDRKDP